LSFGFSLGGLVVAPSDTGWWLAWGGGDSGYRFTDSSNARKTLPEAPPQLLNTSALLEFKTSSWDSQSGATPPNKGREGVIAEDL